MSRSRISEGSKVSARQLVRAAAEEPLHSLSNFKDPSHSSLAAHHSTLRPSASLHRLIGFMEEEHEVGSYGFRLEAAISKELSSFDHRHSGLENDIHFSFFSQS